MPAGDSLVCELRAVERKSRILGEKEVLGCGVGGGRECGPGVRCRAYLLITWGRGRTANLQRSARARPRHSDVFLPAGPLGADANYSFYESGLSFWFLRFSFPQLFYNRAAPVKVSKRSPVYKCRSFFGGFRLAEL